MEENKYTVCKYGSWHFGIRDNTTGLLIRCGPNAQYDKPLDDKDNKLLLFRKRVDAEDFIQKLLGGMEMRKVYGYCRLALANEEEMIEQIKLIEDYCKSNGLELNKTFYDNGASGIKLERNGLNQMLDVLQKGDVIVVKNLARLARNTKHCLVLIERIEEIGATLRVID